MTTNPDPLLSENTEMHLKAFGRYLLENWNAQEGEYWRNGQDDSELKTEDIIPLYWKSEWNPEHGQETTKQETTLKDLEQRVGDIEGFLNFP